MLSLPFCIALLESEEDEEAFAALFHQYHRLVLYKAKQIVKHQESAEDIAQEVFIYVAQHFAQKFRGREETQVKRYLMLCTGSRAADFLREEQKLQYVELECAETETVYIESAEEIVFRAETAAQMFGIVESLPEIYYAALELRLDGESYTDIAEMLNISKETAYKRVQRGYAMVRERMVTENGEGTDGILAGDDEMGAGRTHGA